MSCSVQELAGGRVLLLRFYPPGGAAASGDDYDGVLTIELLSPDIAEFFGALGRRGYQRMLLAVELCRGRGVTRIIAERARRHVMPPPWVLVDVGPVFSRWELAI